MDLQILGTAAAEGWPAVSCDCTNCRKARLLGGKNYRTRSSAMVDTIFKIDWPPDTLHHVHTHHLELHRVQHLIITHGHVDHLYITDLMTRFAPWGHMPESDPRLDIWGPSHVIDKLGTVISQSLPDDQDNPYHLHSVQAFGEYELGDATLIPLPADHSPGSLVYLFSRNDRALLYGHDSGYFPEEAWDYLKRVHLDAVLLDCTNGQLPLPDRFHMGVQGAIKTKRHMQEIGCLNPGCRVLVTHFSHNGGLLHHELEARLWGEGIEVAYDGMNVSV